MKTVKLLVVAIVTLSSLPLLMAQQVNTSAQQNVSASAAGSQVKDSANAGANANVSPRQVQANGTADGSLTANGAGRTNASVSSSDASAVQMRPVSGELQGNLDAKSAKAGDRGVLKTTEKMTTADGTVIPKGSRLVGHVTEVQAHTKAHEESNMGIQFDRAELKGGQSLAIHSMIQSVQPRPSAIAAGSTGNEDAFAGPAGGGVMAGGAAMGSGSAMAGGARETSSGRVVGGGLLGGTASGAAMATGRVGSELGSTAGGAVNTTGHLSGNATGNLARGVDGTAYGAGSVGAHATGFPGMMLNGSASGSASGMLSDSRKNIHLDAGTQMVLGISAAR